MDMTRMLGSGQGEGYEGDQEQEERGHNPLLVLHLLLQGRYWIAVLLAVIFAAAGGIVAFSMTRRTFVVMGMLHIRPVIQAPMFGRDGTMPMYDQFVQTQVVMIKSESCIDQALNSPKWLESGKRSNSKADAERFTKHLDVSKDGEIIRIFYTDPDPETAKAAVSSLIDAYQAMIMDIDPDQPARKLFKLEQIKEDFTKRLGDSRKAVMELAAPYTPDALVNRFNFKQMEANQSEAEWRMSVSQYTTWRLAHNAEAVKIEDDIRRAVAAKNEDPVKAFEFLGDGVVLDGGNSDVIAVTQPKDSPEPEKTPASKPATAAAAASTQEARTPEFIAQYSAEMRDLLQARRNAQMDLNALLATTSIGPRHPGAPVASQGTATVAISPDARGRELLGKAALDYQKYRRAVTEANEVARKVNQIQEKQAEQQQLANLLDEAKLKLEEVRILAAASGRISVVSAGDRAQLKDKRIPAAAAAGFGGAVLGFALIIVWGLLDRRLRTIDQARMSLKSGMRVLGMLPSLPKNLEDPSAASFAALCVHHIRMLLQVMPRLDGHPAIAVTSPSPGDGKTSLTMALALSYAASGKSTLLIDCDIVGAGLTRRVNAIIRRRIGQILIRENLLTAAELREALSAAQRTGRKLGEVLVDEGFVDGEQLEKALKTQGETSVGLLDVMRGEVLEDCVAETGTPRLWILPVGSALAEHGATISPEGFRSVLDQARKRFDVILVDTGPVPGAIESSVAASQVDGVVLTVSRGEQGPLVKRAAEHLRDIGGRALGVVFNRATPEDFSSSYSSMSKPSIPERVREKPGPDMQALGPVAAAVAGQQRTLKEGKE
jgi:Mrp family chromosome partitioning ATPase